MARFSDSIAGIFLGKVLNISLRIKMHSLKLDPASQKLMAVFPLIPLGSGSGHQIVTVFITVVEIFQGNSLEKGV